MQLQHFVEKNKESWIQNRPLGPEIYVKRLFSVDWHVLLFVFAAVWSFFFIDLQINSMQDHHNWYTPYLLACSLVWGSRQPLSTFAL
jgi:hypothetical protein